MAHAAQRQRHVGHPCDALGQQYPGRRPACTDGSSPVNGLGLHQLAFGAAMCKRKAVLAAPAYTCHTRSMVQPCPGLLSGPMPVEPGWPTRMQRFPVSDALLEGQAHPTRVRCTFYGHLCACRCMMHGNTLAAWHSRVSSCLHAQVRAGSGATCSISAPGEGQEAMTACL